jgi:hypothetical protein
MYSRHDNEEHAPQGIQSHVALLQRHTYLAWTVPTTKKSCAIAAQSFVKIACEKSFSDVFTSAHAAQFAPGKNAGSLRKN